MQQGHPRHKQLRRARHEMAIHRRYMFAKKINKSIGNVGKAIVKAMRGIADDIAHVFDSKPDVEPKIEPYLEVADIYGEMHNRDNGVVNNYRRKING